MRVKHQLMEITVKEVASVEDLLLELLSLLGKAGW